MNMTSYNQKSNTEGRCKTIDLPIQDVPDSMLMVVNMVALHDTPSLPWHIIIIRMLWDAARRCNLMTLGSLLTPDRKQGHQINTREGETAPTSLLFISAPKYVSQVSYCQKCFIVERNHGNQPWIWENDEIRKPKILTAIAWSINIILFTNPKQLKS